MSMFLAHQGLGNDGPLWPSTVDGLAGRGTSKYRTSA